jgi:hypothetical protein
MDKFEPEILIKFNSSESAIEVRLAFVWSSSVASSGFLGTIVVMKPFGVTTE